MCIVHQFKCIFKLKANQSVIEKFRLFEIGLLIQEGQLQITYIIFEKLGYNGDNTDKVNGKAEEEEGVLMERKRERGDNEGPTT